MSTPETDRLRRVLASLSAHLDEQTEGLAQAGHLTDGRDALARLTDPDRAEQVAADLAELPAAEAAWLADELERRWGLFGTPVLDPEARLVPAQDDADVVRVEVDGLEPGWSVAWTGATPSELEPATATRTGGPVTARVRGRAAHGRVVLVARAG